MQTSTANAMVNGVMADSNSNDHHEEKFDSFTTDKDESANPTLNAVSSESQAMDTDSSQEDKSIEQSEKDAQESNNQAESKQESEVAEESKTETNLDSESRTENVVSSTSERQTLDLSCKQDKEETSAPEEMSDNERTSKESDESLSSSTDDNVHKEELKKDEGEKKDHAAELSVDSSIQDGMTAHKNGKV